MPAFSGLFAPYWRPDARGAIDGLTRYVTKAHLARAVLEATAFQTREVLDAMNADSGVELTELKVDGGMVGSELLMQFQADILDVPVIRPKWPRRRPSVRPTLLASRGGLLVRPGRTAGPYWAEDTRREPAMGADERDGIGKTRVTVFGNLDVFPESQVREIAANVREAGG